MVHYFLEFHAGNYGGGEIEACLRRDFKCQMIPNNNPKVELGVGKRKVERYIGYMFPEEGWIKLNIDGASKGQYNQAGCGGLLCGDVWGDL